jgi:hypothetical protein
MNSDRTRPASTALQFGPCRCANDLHNGNPTDNARETATVRSRFAMRPKAANDSAGTVPCPLATTPRADAASRIAGAATSGRLNQRTQRVELRVRTHISSGRTFAEWRHGKIIQSTNVPLPAPVPRATKQPPQQRKASHAGSARIARSNRRHALNGEQRRPRMATESKSSPSE